MNRIILAGYLSKDLAPNGTNKVATTQICIEREWPYDKDQHGNKQLDYINLKFLGEKNIVNAAMWLKKGAPIIVEGRYQIDKKKNEDGSWDMYHYALVLKWEFQHGLKDGKVEEVLPAKPEDDKPKQEPPSLQAPDGYEMDIDIDEDLPFMKN